jgi:GT2 family glycosyltransferase
VIHKELEDIFYGSSIIVDASHGPVHPPVCVVIPNRNGRQHLAYCLPSFAQTTYPVYKTLLIDDCSTDDSIKFVNERFPSVYILQNRRSKGFAGVANTGIRWAIAQGFRYVALCNNDIRVLSGWLEPVLDCFEHQKDIAAIGYVEITRNQEEPLVEPSHVQFTDVGIKLPLHACVFDARVIESIGLFDEQYIMYGEETDLFARLNRARYRLLQTNIPVWHYSGGFTQQARFRIAWLSYRNGIRYAVKNESPAKVIRQMAALMYYGTISAPKHVSENWLLKVVAPGLVPSPSEHELAQIDVKLQRLRPSGPVVNFLIWAGAVLWNFLFLPKTLVARHRDTKRVKSCLAANSSEILK